MEVIYGLIPGVILLGLFSVVLFFWAVKSGQYEDMDGPAYRILDDDDELLRPDLSPTEAEEKPNDKDKRESE